MPVFNGERFVSRAIDSLLAQTDADWILHISDNDSTDRTADICKHYENLDARIRITRQSRNIGPSSNFRFLADHADGDYFMWAACDDIWHPQFVETARTTLESDRQIGMSFCNIRNVDYQDEPVRDYPSFGRFVLNDRIATVVRYLLDPEILGKANLLYSVFRLASVREFILGFLNLPIAENYGGDMALVLGLLCRTALAVDDRVLFHKRISESPRFGSPQLRQRLPHVFGNVRAPRIVEYEQALTAAVEGTPFEAVVGQVLRYRRHVVAEVEVLSRTFPLRVLARLGLVGQYWRG